MKLLIRAFRQCPCDLNNINTFTTNCFKMADSFAIPGERLGSTDEFQPGPGTYVRGAFIYSKLVGRKRIIEKGADGCSKAKISIHNGDENKHFVPEKGSMLETVIWLNLILSMVFRVECILLILYIAK